MTGLVIKMIADFCYVEVGDVVYECKARGNIKRNAGNILAGDIVEFSLQNNNKGVVENIKPRKNSFIRPPVANISRLFIISSHNTPAPNALLIDRLTVIANSKNVEPVIVFNKSDLGNLDEWQHIYNLAGFKTFVVSAKDLSSVQELKNYVMSTNGIAVFTGNSGVGKSSLLNSIFPKFCLETGEVSQKLGRGKHTTRKVELYKTSPTCYVADTPGFSSLELEKCEVILKDQLADCFLEFADYSYKCKFTSCSHISEKGCAVTQAVKENKISLSRYESYKILYSQIKDIKEWELKK